MNNDLISRQAAIDEAYDLIIDNEVYRVVQVETLIGLPSAQPERMRGKWKWVPDREDETIMWLCCSVCHHGAFNETNYCPNCGADMRGEDDETD